MKRKRQIPKRDIEFQKSVARLPNSWINQYELLAPQGKINYAYAGQWRIEIYHTQRWLAYSLDMAYTNKHKNVHDKYSRMAIKGYYLCFGLVLLPACEDKLAQLLREFLEIKKWPWKKPKQADEKKTSLKKVIDYLETTKNNPEILEVLNKYWKNKYVGESRELANKIKHRWSPHYIGIKEKLSERLKIGKDEKGEIKKIIIRGGEAPVKENVLYNHITTLKKANNAFVECAQEIDKIINFNQFYEHG